MASLANALLMVMAINVVLFLSQAAVIGINPEFNQTFLNSEGNMIGQFDEGNYTLNTTDPAGRLPGGEGSISPTTGNVFTDMFTAIKGWLIESTGLSYVLNILGAPYHLLSVIGLPQAFTFAIGSLWYGVTLLLLLAFIFGRNT